MPVSFASALLPLCWRDRPDLPPGSHGLQPVYTPGNLLLIARFEPLRSLRAQRIGAASCDEIPEVVETLLRQDGDLFFTSAGLVEGGRYARCVVDRHADHRDGIRFDMVLSESRSIS